MVATPSDPSPVTVDQGPPPPPPPLAGVRIIELAGIGPGPFAGMMLADMGAEVVRVDRPGGNPSAAQGHSVLFRSRRSVAVDLKHPRGVECVLLMCERADALIEGFRPGVTERLGVGPEACQARNPALVYGRVTGWGQSGPLAQTAGHDINYIALTGALHAVGRRGEGPVPPLNLVGDFGGGGMLLAFGVACGLLAARTTGRGQVIDAAMIDGTSALMAMFHGLRAQGLFDDRRGTHQLDSGAHYYDVYQTSDGRWISLGALEPRFYAELCERLGLDDEMRGAQLDIDRWPEFSKRVAARVSQLASTELEEMLSGTDVCYAPVLSLDEAPDHPHNVARQTFVSTGTGPQPAPAPRFGGAPPTVPRPSQPPGTDTRETLIEFGFSATEIDELCAEGAIAEIPRTDGNLTLRHAEGSAP
jgi:alpha-methylacyl-CoA racemase